MEFVKFNKIPRLNRNCVITEKIDGCFDYKSKILTDKGYISIGKIVNQKLNLKVLSYNFDKKQFEYVAILNWFKKPAKYTDFLHIKLKGFKQGASYFSFRCTPNHLILTKNGYVRADELKITDKVCSPNGDLSYIQKQMILGTLLGDASIYIPNKVSRGYRHAQSIKHTIYSNLIKKLLGRFFISERIVFGGYANTEIRHIHSNFDIKLTEYLKKFRTKNKKIFHKKELLELSPISLAFWYMDDGSCNFNNNQKPRMHLATHGFSKKQLGIIIKILKQKFNLFPKMVNYGKGFQLDFNSFDTDVFLNIVAPYITSDLQYKLPLYYRTGKCYWDTYIENNNGFYEQDILEINKNKTTGVDFHYKYDIETKNHNYIVSGIIVHNSNAQIFIYDSNEPLFPNMPIEQIVTKQFINDYALYEKNGIYLFAGSRTRWLNTLKNGDNHGFAKWVQKNAEELFKLGEGRHYGEWYGKGVNRNYGLTENRFALFNVGKWHKEEIRLVSVDPKTKEEKYTEQCPNCCEVVPIIAEGLFTTELIESCIQCLKDNGSIAVPGFMKPEGIIVFHEASGKLFKVTCENDDKSKGINNVE